jgi:multidrug transporter EmrE-like cation transporter
VWDDKGVFGTLVVDIAFLKEPVNTSHIFFLEIFFASNIGLKIISN